MRPLRILFVTPYVPSLLRPRPLNLVKALSRRGHRVTLLAIATSRRELEQAGEIAPFCERVRVVPVPVQRSVWNCAAALVTGKPLQAVYCQSPAVRRALRDALNDSNAGGKPPFDVLHIEHLRAALYGLAVRGLPRVFDSVDCITQLMAEAASHGSVPLGRLLARFDLGRTRRFEREAVRSFDRILVSSPAERLHLARLLGATRGESDRGDFPIEVLSEGVDGDYFRPFDGLREETSLVFVGRMGYHANATAAHYLLAQIMPRLWHRRPDARLTIVGESLPARLRALAARHGPRVRLTGAVPDVRPYLASATVALAPLVYAAGIQNKVLEAMAMATPVVASPAACAALEARDGEHLLVAHDAEEFAASIERLLGDGALCARIGRGGRSYAMAHHDWNTVASRLELLYWEQVEASGRRGSVG